MASPPKPWERAGATASANPVASAATPTQNAINTPSSTTAAPSVPGMPAIPPRPDSLNSAVNQNASVYSRAPYNAAYSPYSPPYNRYGGYGGGMYGGMGGYGGMPSMYGGGMYGGMPGMMPGDPNNPSSLANRVTDSTQATFQLLEGIVGAFGGFAQMLESTYMATHSSFFAMISVAEQFALLRNTLGSVLGIFTIMRWFRTLFAKLTGRPPPVDAMALTPAAFARFEGRQAPSGGAGGQPKASRKPLIFFLLAAFGLPYVMNKIIQSLARQEERKRLEFSSQNAPLDPNNLEFCRVLYDFTPEAGNATQGVDLAVKKGDFIAVLSKSDPLGNPSEWWRCRARDGRLGYLPATFLEVAKRPGQPIAAIKAAPSEPASSGKTAPKPPVVTSKAGDISPESFQKSQFYS
ncbi:Peroxin 13, N-terminal region-domain-containing protein [Daldinia vernicosa]|uniref:Peroxin 13, N-terminal region-domain-containing protein n=1 Tax=Daldinia vernicosa TaxID=114800 RepID=UPI0020087DA1|nr:Peroxin 13, N-terminal region-domain-containing protein [Daldinia vernicosa]KAI0849622.1 Peroxin 13, N-terminal region-domain-containing protein [Daldinia vernicosa]